ncbi:MAG TPA: MarR family transcriptional regulator [Nitrososphaerales archaeon]|nr:MarR family transcriptional regulator [Nitrososphaerales archaeon]
MSSEEIGDLMMVFWQKWRSASPVRRGAITREQYWILRLLMEGGEMKIKDLASAIGCTAGSASVAVKRLERAGLVRRARSEKDERVVTVSLGKQGFRTLDAWRGQQLASMATLFEPLSSDERRTLHGLLEKALAAGGSLPTSPIRSPGGRRS